MTAHTDHPAFDRARARRIKAYSAAPLTALFRLPAGAKVTTSKHGTT